MRVDLHIHSTASDGVYSPGEIAAISELARQQHMSLHMDGARFANADGGCGADGGCCADGGCGGRTGRKGVGQG